MQAEIKVKTVVNKKESNKQCGFCTCMYNASDERRWDVYFCYLTSDSDDPSAFMVCDACRPDAIEFHSDKKMFMQYADGNEWYKVNDYVPLNY